MKISRTSVNYSVEKHQKTGQNYTKHWAGRAKARRSDDILIRVANLYNRRLTILTIIAQLNQFCEKKMEGKNVLKAGLFEELLSRNDCWGSKTGWKGSSGPMRTKIGQQKSGIKSFQLTNQIWNLLGQINRVCAAKSWWNGCPSRITA